MVKTASTMLPVGTVLPDFELEVVASCKVGDLHLFKSGQKVSKSDLPQQPLFLMVICAHCPFVKHLESGITKLNADYSEKIQFLAISSNSLETHPQDGPSNLAKQFHENDWDFPYLFDAEQTLAKALRAACTPDFFLFKPTSDGDQKLIYRGQFDESRPGNNLPVTGIDIRIAFDSLLDGLEVQRDQKPSIGCNIKWHPGEEPDWFG